jgi:hypothetical protein
MAANELRGLPVEPVGQVLVGLSRLNLGHEKIGGEVSAQRDVLGLRENNLVPVVCLRRAASLVVIARQVPLADQTGHIPD